MSTFLCVYAYLCVYLPTCARARACMLCELTPVHCYTDIFHLDFNRAFFQAVAQLK